MNNLSRFSKRARNVMSLAQESAQKLHHSYVGTEHLLAGLVREPEGVAYRVLTDAGVEADAVQQQVEQLTGAKSSSTPAPMELSLRTRQALELAVQEAREMQHDYIGTEHLLLGLLRQGDSTAVKILRRLNMDIDQLRQQARSLSLFKTGLPTSEQQPSAFFVGSPENKRVLDMIEAGSITAAEGIDLLRAMQPMVSMMPGRMTSAPFSAMSNVPDLHTLQLRFVVKDQTSEVVLAEFHLPFIQDEQDLSDAARQIINEGVRSGKVYEHKQDGQHIEVYVEEIS